MLAIVLGLLLSICGVAPDADNRSLADSVKRPGRSAIERDTSTSTGRYLRINRILIIGNRITRDKIILRELSLKSGDIIYSVDLPEVIDKDQKKLINTRLFNTVEIRPLELQEGTVDLLVDLNERWYTFPAPIFELSDRNFNEWWQNYNHDFRRVNYGLRLYQYNLRGRNETLRLTAQFGYQRLFNLSYRIPYFDQRQKHGLVIDLDFQEAKNLAYRTFDHKLEFVESEELLRVTRGAGLTYTYRNSFYDVHSFKIEHRQSEINDTIAMLNPNYYGGEQQLTQKFTSVTYQYSHDHRDIAAYPLKGNHFQANIQKIGFGKKDDLNKLEGFMSYARFLDLKKNYFLSNYSLGYWSFPDDIPYGNYGALGYKRNFVRGYEVYLIEGPFYVLNKTTIKKRIFSNVYRLESWPIEQFRHLPVSVYFKVYTDVGYVSNYPDYDINSRFTDKLLTGIGAGFDVVTSYDAVLRFEYTFNRDGRRGFFFHVKKEF